MILALDTSKTDAFIALIEDDRCLAEKTWPAGRQLSSMLLKEIQRLLLGADRSFSQLTGVIVFAGPGSFTGLRIGISTANAIAYGLGLPIASATGTDWQKTALEHLRLAKPGRSVTPEYGALPKITLPKAK